MVLVLSVIDISVILILIPALIFELISILIFALLLMSVLTPVLGSIRVFRKLDQTEPKILKTESSYKGVKL